MRKMTFVLLCLCAAVLGAAAQGDTRENRTLALETIGNSLTPDGFSRIRFILHTDSRNVTYPIANASEVLADPSYNASKPTVLYMHGYQETNQSESIAVLARAFLQRGSHNFIALDWGDYVGGPFPEAYLRVFAAAATVAAAVTRMVGAGLETETFWPIGHSLGGQLAANVAKNLDFKPSRLTALDPGGPGFSGVPEVPKLGPEDADVVDAIHTDAGVYGYDSDDGTLDFWPNGGHRQMPGCTFPETSLADSLAYCSHRRSWRYFAESVNSETAFPAVRCDSWAAFQSGACSDNSVVYMGFAAPASNMTGTFYLRTGAQEPYGLGEQGTQQRLTMRHSNKEKTHSVHGEEKPEERFKR